MPIRVIDLVNKRKEITVEWEGEAIRIAFRPSSRAVESEVTATAPADRGVTIESLKALLLWWDLVGDDGKPAPVNYEVLDQLPFPLLIAMNRAIVQAMYPNLLSGGTTVAG